MSKQEQTDKEKFTIAIIACIILITGYGMVKCTTSTPRIPISENSLSGPQDRAIRNWLRQNLKDPHHDVISIDHYGELDHELYGISEHAQATVKAKNSYNATTTSTFIFYLRGNKLLDAHER